MSTQSTMRKLFQGAVCFSAAVLASLIVALPVAADDESVSTGKLPRAVQKTVEREAGDGKILEVEMVKHGDAKVFDVDVRLDSGDYELLIRADGTLLSKRLEEDDKESADDDDDAASQLDDGDEDEDGDDEEGEHELKLSRADLPRSVAKTLKRETRGGEIEELKREIDGNRVTYEAEVEFEDEEGERVYEIEIDERGKLLSKVLEVEDDEDENDD